MGTIEQCIEEYEQEAKEEAAERSPVERGVMRDVIKVNHGNVFNTGTWYTFYCPECKRQIGRDNSEHKCHWCDCVVSWD